MNSESLESLIAALKALSKKKDKGAFYPTMMYYEALRWVKLLKQGAIFRVSPDGDNLQWDLPFGRVEEKPKIQK